MKHLLNLPNLNKNQTGFTLIEVLVASFILFLVLAAITMVYRGALLSSHKAERTLQFSSLVEPISEHIRIQIQESSSEEQLLGSGNMGKLIFSWVAIKTHQSKAPLKLNIGTGEYDTGNKTFKLWEVTLNLQLKKASREFTFSEVSW